MNNTTTSINFDIKFCFWDRIKLLFGFPLYIKVIHDQDFNITVVVKPVDEKKFIKFKIVPNPNGGWHAVKIFPEM